MTTGESTLLNVFEFFACLDVAGKRGWDVV
jgi:hypothetical protein